MHMKASVKEQPVLVKIYPTSDEGQMQEEKQNKHRKTFQSTRMRCSSSGLLVNVSQARRTFSQR